MTTPIQNLSFTDDDEINLEALLMNQQNPHAMGTNQPTYTENGAPVTMLQRQVVEEDEQDDVPIEEVEEDNVIDSDPLPESENPTIDVFGHKIDQDTLIIMGVMLVFWILIFFRSGVTDILQNNTTLYTIFIFFGLYLLANTFTSGHKSGGVVYELNILLTVEQMVSILYGTMVLFLLFNKNIPISDTHKAVVNNLGVIIIFLLTIASMWVNLYSSGRSFRFLRKFKQGVYNIALVCFSMILVIYLQSYNNLRPIQAFMQ